MNAEFDEVACVKSPFTFGNVFIIALLIILIPVPDDRAVGLPDKDE